MNNDDLIPWIENCDAVDDGVFSVRKLTAERLDGLASQRAARRRAIGTAGFVLAIVVGFGSLAVRQRPHEMSHSDIKAQDLLKQIRGLGEEMDKEIANYRHQVAVAKQVQYGSAGFLVEETSTIGLTYADALHTQFGDLNSARRQYEAVVEYFAGTTGARIAENQLALLNGKTDGLP